MGQASYQYSMTGGLRIGGCSEAEFKIFLEFKYSPGSLVYICFEARKGVLEEVVIKKIRLTKNKSTYGHFVPIYVDRNNAIYMENELCTRSQAVDMATRYYSDQLVLVNELMQECRTIKRI